MRSLRGLALHAGVVMALALTGCADDSKPNPARMQSIARKPPPPPTLGNFPPPDESQARGSASSIRTVDQGTSSAGNARLILEDFREDLALCARLIEVLRSDVRMADQIEQLLQNPVADLERSLRGTRAYEYKEIRQFIGHRDFVRLEQSPDVDPYAAAVLESRRIICAPTQARLQDIERLGPSPAAWTVREYFLTGMLRAIRMPWSPADSTGVDFEALRDELEASMRIYRGPLRLRVEAWIGNAVNALRREQALAESTPDGRTREEQRQTVGEWIILLESLRSIRIEVRSG